MLMKRGRIMKKTKNNCFHLLFEKQMLETPDNPAVIYNENILTYRELNNKANSLASKLMVLGVKKGDRIVILCNRNTDFFVTILAVSKLGAVYVPIDTSYPRRRIEYIIEDSNSKYIITNNSDLFEKDLKNKNNCRVFDLREFSFDEQPNAINNDVLLSDVFSIIYTSGTTGQPKGVIITHEMLFCFADFWREEHKIQASEKILQFASFSFAVHFLEVTMAFFVGATLYIASEENRKNVATLNDFLKKNNITIAIFPPQLSYELDTKNFTMVFTIGSATHHDIVKKNTLFHDYINLYGCTEAPLISYWKCKKGEEVRNKIPIVKQISLRKVYIFNEHKLCDYNEKGEIYISGSGISPGYISGKKINREKFFTDLICGEVLYKTGDIGSYDDENLMIHGRTEEQFSINGFRISAKEIEDAMNLHPAVDESVVSLLKEGKNEVLCGFYIANNTLQQENLKKSLEEILPYYMIPRLFYQVSNFNRNINGKIDRKRLPKLKQILKNNYQKPCNNEEIVIASIFEDVLSLDCVGRNNDFFEIGGNSINVLQVLNAISEKYHINIGVSDFYNNSSVQKLSKLVRIGEDYKNIPKLGKTRYRMSPIQKGLYIDNVISNYNLSYNNPRCYKLHGNIDINRLIYSINMLLKQHEIMRSKFSIWNGEYVQTVDNEFNIEIPIVDFNGNIESHMNEFVQPFDISNEYGFRAKIVKSKKECWLLLDFHHIIFDGRSENIIKKALSVLYRGDNYSCVKIQYGDFSEWYLSQDFSVQRHYWQTTLKDAKFNTNLFKDIEKGSKKNNSGKTLKFILENEFVKRIKQLSLYYNLTEYTILIGALILLLHTRTKENNICVGTPISLRRNNDLDKVIGPLINTIIVHSIIDKNVSIEDFLTKNLKHTIIKSIDNGEYPFPNLLNDFADSRVINKSPFFDIMFIFQNNTEENLFFQDVLVEEVDVKKKGTKFDLTINVIPKNSSYHIECEFNTEIYSDKTITDFMQEYETVLYSMLTNPKQKICDLKIDCNDEHLINNFGIYDIINRTDLSYDNKLNVIQLFKNSVNLNNHKIALQFCDLKYTYKELLRLVNIFAASLYSCGVAKGDRVALLIERSPNSIIAMFAVLMLGAIYIPIDVDFPKERILYMINDSNAKMVIVSTKTIETFSELKEQVNVFNVSSDINNQINVIDELTDLDSSELAYIIYTSGSTGKPKGVMINHQNIVNFILGMNNITHIGENESIIAMTTISFDIFVLESILALTLGLTVILTDESCQKNPLALKELIVNNAPQVLQCTPSRLEWLSKIDREFTFLKSVKLLLIGGDMFPEKLLLQLKRFYSKSIYNVYGPTETTVWSTAKDLTNDNHISVGKPLSNTQIYIMDSNKNLLPVNTEGELYIGGHGVSCGYNNLEEQTAEKFIFNPFGKGYLYKTGDLAKINENLDVEILGRSDFQVKIRGYRIEIQEIEKQIESFETVDRAVVVSNKQDETNNDLIAFVECNKKIQQHEILNHLRRNLPEYMIPSKINFLQELPLTANGKVDRKKLIEFSEKESTKISKIVIEQNDSVEKNLYKIWCSILGISIFDKDKSFFEIGGNSFLIVLLYNEIEKFYPNTISITDVFEYYTFNDMLAFINQKLNKILYKDSLTTIDTIVSMFENENIDIIEAIKMIEDN